LKEGKNNMMRVVLTLVLYFGATCHAAQDRFPAGEFWASFRQAVLANDEKKIVSMTKLPLAVYGVSDNIPVTYYDRNEFPAIFRKILMQPEYLPVGNRIVSKTVLGLIYDKKVLTHNDLQNRDAFRFYQLEFEVINGRWFLTRAYLEQ
jgi:hypothetical protein